MCKMLQGEMCVQGAGPYHIYVTQAEDKNVDSITYRLVMTTDRSTLCCKQAYSLAATFLSLWLQS